MNRRFRCTCWFSPYSGKVEKNGQLIEEMDDYLEKGKEALMKRLHLSYDYFYE